MHEFIFHLPEQIKDAIRIARTVRVQSKKIRNLVIAGMGGSGIGGELLQGIYAREIKIPIFINKDYELPPYAGRDTLVMLVSYSGNTEETLSNFVTARRRGCIIAAISSGGKLLARCDNGLAVKIPAGLPPRAAIGYLFTPLLFILWHYNLIANPTLPMVKLAGFLKKERSAIITKAKRLARWLFGRLPIIYANSTAYGPVAYRWCCQFNENAKIFAHSHKVPEMNHNEIVGIGGTRAIAALSKIILLNDPGAHVRNKKRVEITKNMIGKEVAGIRQLTGEGRDLLQRVFYLIWLGDWTSYFLAQLGNVDPLPVQRINELKARL